MDNKLKLQIELETLYNKNQLIPRIRSEFQAEPDFTIQMEKHNIDVAFGFDVLAQMALHKRCDLPTLVGVMRHHYADKHDGSQRTANEILKCAKADLIDWNPAFSQFVVIFEVTADVQEELDRYQFPLPMVVEPREVRSNTDSGYIKSKSSIILKNNHHEDDVCLDHINRMNAIRFSLDMDTANMIANSWRNLDRQKPSETKQNFEKRKRAFEKYDRTAREVMDKVTALGNEFYLTHRYDKRGRIYCQGYHVNYQGNAWNKAVVELADKEMVI